MANSCAVSGSSGCDGVAGAVSSGCADDCDPCASKFRQRARIGTIGNVPSTLRNVPRWIGLHTMVISIDWVTEAKFKCRPNVNRQDALTEQMYVSPDGSGEKSNQPILKTFITTRIA